MPQPHDTLALPRTLEDGLILRLATPDDIDTLAAFNQGIHFDGQMPGLDTWTRVMMGGKRPGMSAADFLLVEDPAANHKITSTTCLIPQVWTYDGIPVSVGQPELVGTDPDYRRRGLSRTVMEAIHQISAAYGHQMQCVAGIGYFYRQFEYEYALDLGGYRFLSMRRVPALKDDEAERFRFRRANEDDIPVLMRLSAQHNAQYKVATHISEADWRYYLTDRHPDSPIAGQIHCMLNAENKVTGYYSAFLRTALSVVHVILDNSVSYFEALPPLLRTLQAQAKSYAASREKVEYASGIRFDFGTTTHPIYDLLEPQLEPLKGLYAWYVRVPDVAGFLRHIRPALDQRLADSAIRGFSGALKLNFYRSGLRLDFEAGKLTQAANLDAREASDDADAAFPPLVFLKLLFGYRSLAQLREAFPDCWANDKGRLLLNALFPRQASGVLDWG